MGSNLSEVLKARDNLFMTSRFAVVTDCVREWAILIFGIWVMVYFSVCARRIYKTTLELTFDVLMLLIEVIKVSPFGNYLSGLLLPLL
jgi:hypothetical protein